MPEENKPPTDSASQYPDAVALFRAYKSFKLFLMRMVGFVAAAYGAVTLNAYYFLLGIAAVALFWYWDRLIAANGRDRPAEPAETNHADDCGQRPEPMTGRVRE